MDELIKRLLQNLVTITDKRIDDMKPKFTDNKKKSWTLTFVAIGLIFAILFDIIPMSADYWLSKIFTFY